MFQSLAPRPDFDERFTRVGSNAIQGAAMDSCPDLRPMTILDVFPVYDFGGGLFRRTSPRGAAKTL